MASATVLLLQSNSARLQQLLTFFEKRGDEPFFATSAQDVEQLMPNITPSLIVVDLHLLDDAWQSALRNLRQQFPLAKFLFTTNYPNPELEQSVKKYKPIMFLQHPVTQHGLERALLSIDGDEEKTVIRRNLWERYRNVRFPIGTKLTMPYVILAIFVAMMAGYIVSKLVAENVEERFLNQLLESSQLTSDLMVREEKSQLETFRLLVNTDGFRQGIETAASEQLREITLPIAVNAQQEAIEILDSNGRSLLSLRHRTGGNLEEYDSSKDNDVFASWPFVQAVLNRQVDGNNDKHAGVVRAEWGDYFYVAGPVLDADDNLIGTVLIGQSLPTIVGNFRMGTFAQVTAYDDAGRPYVTTLPTDDILAVDDELGTAVFAQQDSRTLMRNQTIGSLDYVEMMIPWEAQGGTDIGILGIALPQSFLFQASQGTQLQLFLLIIIALLSIITVGILLSNRITSPLLNIVRASTRVAEGNLDVTVEPVGRDEVSLLASSFNQMVASLREGAVYRDLLGRTVTPAVREEMRRSLVSGTLRLEGQNQIATALFSDIRSFTSIAEQNSPTAVFSMLNEYFVQVVPAITNDGGLVTDFAGDAVLAFFGLLPRPLSPADSAYQACVAGVKMLRIIEQINLQRARDGRPPFVTGIGINTGEVSAGSIGSADRMHYTVIGDTVNTSQRLESFTKSFGETAVVVSQHTYEALGNRRDEFRFEPLGPQLFKGKSEQLLVYRLCD